MTEAKEKKPLLLKKWLLLELALNDKRLSKGDCAVNWQILDRYNPDKGAAYPGMKRLATDTGFTQRNVQNSITRLVKTDYVAIIQHGNQTRTNRYRPNFLLLDRVEKASSLPDEGVEKASSKGREDQFPNVENASSLKPNHEPAYERGVNELGIVGFDFCKSKPPIDATPPPPLTGASLASGDPKTKYQYQDFWAIYPKQMNVSKAETEITEALKDGALLDDILDGARRYAVYVKHQGWCGDHKYISLPHNWIKGKRWLDSWEVSPKSKIKTEFEVEAQPAKKTAVKDAPRNVKPKAKVTSKAVKVEKVNQFTPGASTSPAYNDFMKNKKTAIKQLGRDGELSNEKLMAHIKGCELCRNSKTKCDTFTGLNGSKEKIYQAIEAKKATKAPPRYYIP